MLRLTSGRASSGKASPGFDLGAGVKEMRAGRITRVEDQNGDHYLVRQPDLVDFSADTIADWISPQSQ